MPTYKLTYFDVRAKAELARLLFAYKQQPFEDVRISGDEWPKLKPQTPFGQVPILEIDGKQYTESMAINNYLAREFGLYGSSNMQKLEIDQVLGKIQDIWTSIIDWIHAQGDQAKAEVKKANEEINFPKCLEVLEKILTANGTGYFVGNEVTYADIAVFDALDIEVPEALIEKYPKVKANRDMILNNDRLKDYIATRPKASM